MPQTYLITGANRGIGQAMAHQLLDAGHTVIAACRREPSDLIARGATFVPCDVTKQQDVDALADALQPGEVDVAILNAGILRADSLQSLDFDAMREQFEVNALGPLRVAAAIAPKLEEGALIALTSSRMGSIEDNTSGGYYGYRTSKTALNSIAMSLSRDLAEDGIGVLVLHPGFVQTDMTGGRGEVDATTSARGMLARIEEGQRPGPARFRHANGRELPW